MFMWRFKMENSDTEGIVMEMQKVLIGNYLPAKRGIVWLGLEPAAFV